MTHWAQRLLIVSTCLLCLQGCATIHTYPPDARQEHVQQLADAIAPHTPQPDTYYWIRILNPTTRRAADLLVLPQEHIYLSESLVQQADDNVLTALLAHAMAHHTLGHFRKRWWVQAGQYVGFLISGAFVPGLSLGTIAAYPLVEGAMSAGQEYTADAKALTYLKPLGYSKDDYIQALTFFAGHRFTERTGGVVTTQGHLNDRIKALRK